MRIFMLSRDRLGLDPASSHLLVGNFFAIKVELDILIVSLTSLWKKRNSRARKWRKRYSWAVYRLYQWKRIAGRIDRQRIRQSSDLLDIG